MTKSGGSPVLPSSLVAAKRFVSTCDEAWLFIKAADWPSEGKHAFGGGQKCRSFDGAFIRQIIQRVFFHQVELQQPNSSAVLRLT